VESGGVGVCEWQAGVCGQESLPTTRGKKESGGALLTGKWFVYIAAEQGEERDNHGDCQQFLRLGGDPSAGRREWFASGAVKRCAARSNW